MTKNAQKFTVNDTLHAYFRIQYTQASVSFFPARIEYAYMRGKWKRCSEAYSRFIDDKGFALLAVLCTAIITGTAVWTGKAPAPSVTPTIPPVPAEGYHVSSLYQQALADAATPTPLPSSQPILWSSPLEEVNVLQDFTDNVMRRSNTTGLWATHPAIDLAAPAGEPVAAMASGTVTDCGVDAEDGIYVVLSHGNGYETRYAGLAARGAIQKGDPVKAGQTIGFIGSGVIGEDHLPAHLHLQVFERGIAIDPLTLLP